MSLRAVGNKDPALFRVPTGQELALLYRLLETDFPGQRDLREQIDRSLVRRIDENGSLEFLVGPELRAPVEARIPTEGYTVDTDGVLVHVLLHVLDGLVAELEIYKEDSSPVHTAPSAATLQLLPP